MSGKRKRTTYTPEYRDQAVRLVVDTGRPIVHVAPEIGVGEQLLGRWVAAAKARSAADNPEVLDDDERKELERLRKWKRRITFRQAVFEKSSGLLRLRTEPVEMYRVIEAEKVNFTVNPAHLPRWIPAASQSSADLEGWTAAALLLGAVAEPGDAADQRQVRHGRESRRRCAHRGDGVEDLHGGGDVGCADVLEHARAGRAGHHQEMGAHRRVAVDGQRPPVLRLWPVLANVLTNL